MLTPRRAFLRTAATSALIPLLRGQDDTTFSAGVRVVNVLATVRDREGHIVKSLTKDDFTLKEDARPQVIRYFSQQTDLPLTLGLLIDSSASQRRVLGAEQNASFRFLKQVMREDRDQAFVIHFDREVELLQDLTSNRQKLEAALSDIEVAKPQTANRGGGMGSPGGSGGMGMPGGGGMNIPGIGSMGAPRGRRRDSGMGGSRGGGGNRDGGGTALYDAVLLGSDEIMRHQRGRKAMILLSDGVDNASKVSLERALEAAQRADTLAYSILFSDAQAHGGAFGRFPGSRGNAESGVAVLKRAARNTGGGYFEVSGKQTLDQIFDQIQEELRNQYNLGYSPDRPDSTGFRNIAVTANKPGLTVQARAGYYAGQ
jgi:VWFA-related protein